jgi:hypothetical protein
MAENIFLDVQQLRSIHWEVVWEVWSAHLVFTDFKVFLGPSSKLSGVDCLIDA